MFLKHQNKMVNTDNVTNIRYEQRRIIFNMDYSVSHKDNDDNLIQDYVMFDFEEVIDMNTIKEKIDTLGWINSEFGDYDKKENYRANDRIINPAAIASVKFEDYHNRIIFNLNVSASMRRNAFQKTSDFIFYGHTDKYDYENERKRITNLLTGEE